TELGLPDNDSYRCYADIGRPYAVWNVVAAAEFSLEPKQWCFPIAGCVSYKGYFKRAKAEKLAIRLQTENFDVDLYGVQAYSTLNWFDDPILNTFIASSDARLAGLLFHELAHQLIYIPGDTPFNEALAMTVQIEGVRRWFLQTANPEKWRQFLGHQDQNAVFQNYLQGIHEQLRKLYQNNFPVAQMRKKKQQIIAKALADFDQLKRSGELGHGFDRWMARGLNNARLASIATYRELIPGFQALLKQCQGKLGCFYGQVRALSKLPRAERLAQLKIMGQATLTAQNQGDL
ncbi:MAG: aminopeptidase, partial [Desulfuromusa sp.]